MALIELRALDLLKFLVVVGTERARVKRRGDAVQGRGVRRKSLIVVVFVGARVSWRRVAGPRARRRRCGCPAFFRQFA